ncbi:MAG: protein O-mannosyl-transferase family, partial [Phycisphaerae bacterium]
ALGVVMQIRLGVPAGLAGASMLVVAGHPRVWQNLLAPEVYAPSLLLYAGGVYLLWRYARGGRRADLIWGALLWGLTVATRPATVISAPFLILAFYFSAKQHHLAWGPALRRLGIAMAVAVAPTIYSLAFLWVRDTPTATYNYIEQYNAEARAFPGADQGPKAKLERIVWQARGAQFANMMGNSWRGVRTRFRWLAGEMELDTRLSRWAAAALVVGAWGLGFSRCKIAGCLLVGMMVQNLAFVCAYRVSGQAANILPMLWAGGVLAGVAASVLPPSPRSKWRAKVGAGVLAAAGVWTVLDHRVDHGRLRDATRFVEQADLATLPDNAVIWSDWGTSPPLWYARAVSTKRMDIAVVNASPGGWPHMISAYRNGPIFYINEQAKTPEGYTLEPYRNLWKLVPESHRGQ